MGLLSFLTRPIVAGQIARVAEREGVEAAVRALSLASDGRDPGLWLDVADRLLRADRREDVAQLLRSAPDCPEVLAARASVSGSADEATTLLERAVELRPANEGTAAALAAELVAKDELERAVALLEPFRDGLSEQSALILGEALFGLERHEDALEVVRPHVLAHEADARSIMGAGISRTDVAQQLLALHNELVSLVAGDEGLTVDLAARRQLDGGAAVNHRLLARSLMLNRPRLAPTLELRSVEATAALGTELRANGKDEATALVQLGQAALRRGAVRDARELFNRARELAPDHFGASLGDAVCLDILQRDLVSKAGSLPHLTTPPAIEAVVPDWAALTPLERRVVVASIEPLEWMLPVLAAQGCRVRVLPLDVRPVDLPELAELSGTRVDGDHRSWEGIEGLASSTLAVVKVETLCDVTPNGWTFGHEFAHLCELRLPAAVRGRLDALYERALDAEYAFEQYALQNVHEFFAVNYQHALCERYGIALEREHDDEGLLAEAIRLFAPPTQAWPASNRIA
ncbi:MAG: hypothetical protein JNJ54_00575 [Myxococcaceae bacterium]|nr:hypothetical protein [Myxococcaceae bacterium]